MSAGIGRAAVGASIGTLFARILGFARNIVLTAAIGTGLVADSYAVADNVPNMIFLLLGGGTIAAVFVPQLVGHAGHSDERAEQYGSLLIVCAAVFGAVVSALVILTGPALIAIVGGAAWDDRQATLSMALLVWCAPQVFFLAIYWVVAQILNSRGKFSSVTWLPALSSVVVIAGCVALLLAADIEPNVPVSMSPTSIALLGGATLAGSAIQSVALFFVLRANGFRLRLRFPLRGMGLRRTAITALWLTVSTGLYQASNLVAVTLSTRSGSEAAAAGLDGRGYTSLFYAQSLILVVGAVAVTSLSTVLLQRLSKYYAAKDTANATTELDEVMMRVASVTVPIAGVFVALGPLIGEVLFARGNTSVAASAFIGLVLAVLALGLLPNALHNVMLRPFFATSDGRSPLFSALRVGVIWIVISLFSSLLLPPEWVVVGVAAGYVLSFGIELPFKLRRLRRAVDYRTRPGMPQAILRLLLAAAVAALVTGLAAWQLGGLVPHEFLPRLAFTAGLGGIFLLIYHGLTRRTGSSLVDLLHWIRK